jgi:spore maturation protein SpmA
MLNWIWLALVLLAVAIGGWNNRLGEVGMFKGARSSFRPIFCRSL